MRLLPATLLLCLALPTVALAQPIVDDRYPSFGNRMTGNQLVKEPRWGVSRQRAGKRHVKAKHARRSPVRRMQAPHRAYMADAPARFIRGRLVCARNINAALAARGQRGSGSARAKDFLKWGTASGPVIGAVAVFSRGRDQRNGHAAIVVGIRNGQVIYANPSSRRQAWVVGPYRRQPIAFRVAS